MLCEQFIFICMFTMIFLRFYWLSWTPDPGSVYHMTIMLGSKFKGISIHHRINDPNSNVNMITMCNFSPIFSIHSIACISTYFLYIFCVFWKDVLVSHQYQKRVSVQLYLNSIIPGSKLSYDNHSKNQIGKHNFRVLY